ncbi:unnamed protein product [Cyprideis torosa]|uniref:CCR4-NOT transcription complex subunit 10 n=2 Tax=Cyprideis torosa TaxID=163714 RepID=A0A7R8ZLJ0_9CRUS|nr:unnamed protein product [Cyprideis torosa]CAG0882358.1 unnamed protein product [Cyprideis torosa]
MMEHRELPVTDSDSDSQGLPTEASEHERSTAKNALMKFNAGDYATSLAYLKDLQSTRPSDWKLKHNKTVVTFYESGCCDSETCFTELQKCFPEDETGTTDPDQVVLVYNFACVLFHTGKPWKCLEQLNKILMHADQLEDGMQFSIQFLRLEALLSTHQPEMVLRELASLEGNLGDGDDDRKTQLANVKFRCYLQLRNTRGVKKELKAFLSQSEQSPSRLFCKAHLDYLKGNLVNAMTHLSLAMSSSPLPPAKESLYALYNNAVGCVQFRQGKPLLAAHFFRRAIEESARAQQSAPADDPNKPMWLKHRGIGYEALYNLGVSYLHAGKVEEGFSCLMTARTAFDANPLLWLRLAECCVAAYFPDNSEHFSPSLKRNLVAGQVGISIHRKLIMGNSFCATKQVQPSDLKHPDMTLDFAVRALKNALWLVEIQSRADSASEEKSDGDGATGQILSEDFSRMRVDSPETTQGKGNKTGTSTPFAKTLIPKRLQVYPSLPLKPTDLETLRCSILCTLAFVFGRIGGYYEELKYATKLLARPNLNPIQSFLGHLYAGEALLGLDRISEAVDHFSPGHMKQPLSWVNHPLEEKKEGAENKEYQNSTKMQCNWFPRSQKAALMVLRYNCVVAFTVRGEYDKAGEELKQLWSLREATLDIPVAVIMIACYIQLMLGNVEVARKILRTHSPHFRQAAVKTVL